MKHTLQEIIKSARTDENILKAYASKKCNRCFGKGYFEIKPPGEPTQNVMCDCFVKGIKKEFSKDEK